ncbi:MAG: 4Fe-4S dicluster domain-containing protein [Rubrivivax sp.]
MAKGVSRRNALSSVLAFGGITGLLGVQARGEVRRLLPADRIRPPGALRESGFLEACVRCGLCVQACPYDTLNLADLGASVPAGTPYFVARQTACEMCITIPCVAACPTGALRSSLTDITDAAMGLAELSAPGRCLSTTGAAYCDSCFQACPVKGLALRMQPGHTARGGNFTPFVDAGYCTGCGCCEAACVLQGNAAITVRANHVAQR